MRRSFPKVNRTKIVVALWVACLVALPLWPLAQVGGHSLTVTVTPRTSRIALTDTVVLTATVTGASDRRVFWRATGGTFTDLGNNRVRFDPPNRAGTWTVTAISFQSSLAQGTATVTTVDSATRVSLSPTQATVGLTGTVDFTATVTGPANKAVRWTATRGTFTSLGTNRVRFDPPNVAGTYVVTATSVATPTAKATANVVVSAVPLATLRGFVVRRGTTSPVPGVAVIFFDLAGRRVGATRVNSAGVFSAVVPTTVRRVHLDPSTLPRSGGLRLYYSAYEYNGRIYEGLISSCSVVIPPLAAGRTVTISPLRVFAAGGPPPPPPTGCG